MPATDSEFTSMEDPHELQDEEGSLASIPSSVPPATVPPSPPLVPTTMRPNFTSEAVIETKAVSVASNNCSSARSSPAEASPAKAAVTSPTTFDGTAGTSPPTSRIASASDSLTCTKTVIVNISESSPTLPELPSFTFGSADLGADYPTVLTFKGVSVTLENNSVWKQFNGCGTEMILTKQGRRMFPYCRYRLAGLNPDQQYSLVLSIVPSDPYRYRWSTSKWEVNGPAEHQAQSLIRAFSHHYSPCRGSEWMGGLVSFYKLKLTNNSQDQEGHIILHSMHRYIPRLHVIPVPDGGAPTADEPVVMGPECMTFTFPQTEFMAVTTYQNFRITQLKINHNPFAKGFREDGNNPRLNRVSIHPQPMLITDIQPAASKPAEPSDSKEGIVDLSTKNHTVSASPSKQKTRLVLKPIMSTSGGKDEPYVPCIRGKHALGELVLVQKRPRVEPSEEIPAVSVTPKAKQGLRVTPKATTVTPTSTPSTPGSSPGHRKRRKRINRHWANSRGKEWKAATASPTVVHSPSLTVAMQPELDDVEGLLFVSFTSKEALEVHLRDKPASNSSSPSPVSLMTPMQLKQTEELIPETDEEKIVRLETTLLQDLRVLKHRQAIHPVLQEVGMKLSCLDSTKSIDLQYLGVCLPLPPPNLLDQDGATSPADEGLPFISRTGKTSDMTKIKGWKNKFIRRKETSLSNSDGSQKNLSAFCSNMLDEYLESEGQYISERADAFSTNPEGSVAYQLPAKSSSYVKTLDSVLKHRNVVSKSPAGANRPCPLSHKPLLYSALTSPAPPLASAETPVQTGAQSHTQQPRAAMMASGSNSTSSVSQRSSTYHPGVSQRSAVSFGQSEGVTHRPSGLTKFQLRLWQMENAAMNEGLSRTQLTPGRLSVALSVLLTKQMMSIKTLRVAQYPKSKDEGPACGQDFCRLGCVCSSLQQPNRGPLHCRRTECMFGCACFKRKITKQEETEPQIQPSYSMTNMEHVVQPHPGSHANKLWNHNIHDVDPEPLFAPKSAPQSSVPSKVVKSSSSIYRPVQQQIREEDKDPVYRFLESMMTCARVREFNSKPPPEVTLEPNISDTSKLDTTAKPQKTPTHDEPKMYYRTLLTTKKTEQTSQGTAGSEAEARKQIEIQSACQWDKDRKKVLEALCRRMNQNKLSKRFYIGPYRICPVAKIFMRKPSGSIVTYRLHISKPSKASDDDEDELDDSDEDAEEEFSLTEEPETQFGVTPFLSGVLPAGRLRARTKPAGCQAYGLIQVNGKCYNQARLLLGNMGSLHPANRLAAYVTGRLHVPADLSLKEISQKSNPANKTDAPDSLQIKTAGTVVPPIITARKTTELKTPAAPPARLPQPGPWRNGSISMPQHLQNSSTINPVQAFVLSQLSSVSSTSSPVSLTVSQSLKTPSFLGQSGTYSFRICPPTNQGTGAQNLPGVALPGGFTLIQLPNPGADGAQKSESVNQQMAVVDKAPTSKDALFNFARLAADPDSNWLGLDAVTAAKTLLSSKSVQTGCSPELKCDEKIPSDESDEANIRRVDSNLDITSEDLDSDSSDYCGEGDEDDELVDIETVEEEGQGVAIARMKEAAARALQESRYSRDDLGSARELDIKDEMDDGLDQSKDKKRRKNHTVLERRRRSEQRTLFNRLHFVLQSDPRAPRLRLLSLAVEEIQNLVEKSKHLEEKKRRLTQMQSVYVKELSLLSGKSDQLIRHKLKEICDKHKMREKAMKWRPFFSNLLQSKAALVQATTPQSRPHHAPLLKPDFFTSSSQAEPQSSVDQTPRPGPSTLPLAVSSPAQAGVTAASVLAENWLGEPEASTQLSMSNSQSACQPQVVSVASALQATAAQDGPSPGSSNPKSSNPSACTAQPFTLPLIRSKTGRIILPSSLKPLGQGFYTLMVMKPKEEDDENITQPPVVVSKSDHPSHSENSHTSAQDKSMQFPNSEPKRSGVKPPLAELALLNKSIPVPSVALQAVENSQEGGTAVGAHKTVAAALSFRRLARTTPPSAEPESELSPPIARRGRGRPRKNPVTPVSVGKRRKHTLVEDTSESESSFVVEKRRSPKIRVKTNKEAAVVSDDPVPVKRGRGRPPKNKSALPRTPSITRLNHSFKSPNTKPKESLPADVNTSRPLTRGALGKDFPSAKKRSWIDLEKELEPELESESELESEPELELESE